MRSQDRLTACELEPAAARALAANLRRDRRAKATALNGWTALTAYIPPKERRGLAFIDPPYEQPDEFDRAADALVKAHRKWPTGCYLLWYPIKDRAGPDHLTKGLRASGILKILRAELLIAATGEAGAFGSGVILINPPWRLEEELAMLLPDLAVLLAQERGAAHLDWLRGER